MSVFLTDEEQAVAREVRRFVQAEVVEHAAAWDRDGCPADLMPRLGALGWLDVPGSALYAVICRELARASAGMALQTYVHAALACGAIEHLGTGAQRDYWLPAARRGDRVGCWAYAEPNAGADVSSVQTRARSDGDGWVLNGSKLYITNAPIADFAVIVARTDAQKRLDGLSVFVVKTQTPGLRIGPPMAKLGMGASQMAEIVLDDCRVPSDALLGPKDTGFSKAIEVLTLGRIAAAAFAVGLGEAALNEALSYTSTRVQFGKPLVAKQFVRFTVADLATRLEAAWLLTLKAARLADVGKPYATAASMAKLFASETCTWACERALHLCGAQGYMAESAVQRFYRDCKVLELGEGTSEIQRETIARALGR